jgi:uncharacterized damage-inducible protein DinB
MSDPEMESYLQAYLACVDELESAVAGLSEIDLDKNAGRGWTIRQIVHHVTDGDDIWKNCILLILGTPGAEFHLSWYWVLTQDEWVAHWQYQQRGIQDSLMRLRVNRRFIVDLLRKRSDAWQSSARIHWPGDAQESLITIAEIIGLQTNHARNHSSDICAIRQLGNSSR